MKKRNILTTALLAFAVTGIANAADETGGGGLGISGDVEASINLTFVTDASGLAVTGTGTSTASLPFATVSMYGGSVPTNVTKTPNGTTSFDLSTPFDVRVDKANLVSTDYTLAATLSSAEAGTKVWKIGATDISAGTLVTLTSAGAYATAVPYTFTIRVLAADTSLSIAKTINFLATAN